jgi:hypothetical protein
MATSKKVYERDLEKTKVEAYREGFQFGEKEGIELAISVLLIQITKNDSPLTRTEMRQMVRDVEKILLSVYPDYAERVLPKPESAGPNTLPGIFHNITSIKCDKCGDYNLVERVSGYYRCLHLDQCKERIKNQPPEWMGRSKDLPEWL